MPRVCRATSNGSARGGSPAAVGGRGSGAAVPHFGGVAADGSGRSTEGRRSVLNGFCAGGADDPVVSTRGVGALSEAGLGGGTAVGSGSGGGAASDGRG